MAIELRSSIGTPTANSYVSLASANSYFQVRENSEGWNDISSSTSSTGAANDKKRRLLIQATKEIDKTYRFYGSKASDAVIGDSEYQNLEFPRTDNVDNNGNEIIIEDVKITTYEQALWILNRTSPVRTEDGEIVERAYIGKEAYLYLRPYIDRTVRKINMYPRPLGFNRG